MAGLVQEFRRLAKVGKFPDLAESGDIVSLARAHGTGGFLVACTTQASASCMRHLDNIERNQNLYLEVWDAATFSKLLGNPRVYALFQQYFPTLGQLNEMQVFRTESPNRFVIISKGFYVLLDERHESTLGFQLDSAADFFERIVRLQETYNETEALIRPRRMFFDNSHGTAAYSVDVVVNRAKFEDQLQLQNFATEATRAVNDELNTPTHTSTGYYDGQFSNVVTSARIGDFGGDKFDKDHYTWYRL